jgi:isocitrate lyase
LPTPDTGYGGLLNVHHTVRGYEEVGVVAIQIEDQEFPKKCGHTPFKKVVPTADMVEKVKVACDARRNAETLIIARTDARQTDGFDGALERVEAYADAGADIVFVEALESEGGNAPSLRADQKANDGEYGRRRQNADPLKGGTRGDPLSARDFSRHDGIGFGARS